MTQEELNAFTELSKELAEEKEKSARLAHSLKKVKEMLIELMGKLCPDDMKHELKLMTMLVERM